MSVRGRPEEDVEPLGAGVMSNSEPSDMGVGTKLGPLEEQKAFLTNESFLLPNFLISTAYC